MEGCIYERPKGGLCGRKVQKGHNMCRYHLKKSKGIIKHGRKADMAKVLGLTGEEAMSYEAFMAQHKPHELHNELFQLRALLVAYRKAYAAMSDELKELFLNKTEEFCASYLIETTGMVPEKAYHIASLLLPPVGDSYDELLESLAISDDYIKKVSGLIKDIGWLAEKAVKIRDGMTLHLVTNNQDFIDFIQDVVFVVVKSPKDRAELARLTQIWLGRSSPKEDQDIVDGEYDELVED